MEQELKGRINNFHSVLKFTETKYEHFFSVCGYFKKFNGLM